MYLVASVVDGVAGQPITFNGQVHERVKNGDVLPTGTDGGRDQLLNIFLKEGGLPPILGVSFVVFRSNEDLRQFGGLLAEVTADQRYERLSNISRRRQRPLFPPTGSSGKQRAS